MMRSNKNNSQRQFSGSGWDGRRLELTTTAGLPPVSSSSTKKNNQQQQQQSSSSAEGNRVHPSVKSLNNDNNNSPQQQRKRKASSLPPSGDAVISVGGDERSKKMRHGVKNAGNATGNSSNNNNRNSNTIVPHDKHTASSVTSSSSSPPLSLAKPHDVPPGNLGLTLLITPTHSNVFGAKIRAIDKEACGISEEVSVGDVIVSIDENRVTTPSDFERNKDTTRTLWIVPKETIELEKKKRVAQHQAERKAMPAEQKAAALERKKKEKAEAAERKAAALERKKKEKAEKLAERKAAALERKKKEKAEAAERKAAALERKKKEKAKKLAELLGELIQNQNNEPDAGSFRTRGLSKHVPSTYHQGILNNIVDSVDNGNDLDGTMILDLVDPIDSDIMNTRDVAFYLTSHIMEGRFKNDKALYKFLLDKIHKIKQSSRIIVFQSCIGMPQSLQM